MKWYSRFNTVFYKLIFTYILLIMITILFMGISSYMYFSANFNKEIESVNDRMLGYLRNTLDENVLNRTEKIYLELFIPQHRNDELFLLFEESPSGNHANIYSNYVYLKNVVSLNSTILQSIDIYYKDHQMMLSSQSGMKYIEDEESIPWLHQMMESNKMLHWLAKNETKGDSDVVSLIGSYPQNSSTGKKGYMAIHIKKSALTNLISESSSDATGQIFLLNEQGIIAKGRNDDLDYNLDRKFFEETVHSGKKDDNFITDINGIKSIVSYKTIESSDWKLVNISPVEQFYQKSDAIHQAILLIGIIAVIIGIVISNIFTRNLYDPIKTLISRTKNIFEETGEQHIVGKNEYHLIDNVIDNLSIKVKGLESALSDNFPIIRSKLASDLIQGKVKSEQELEERLNLLDNKIGTKDFYTVLSIKMNATFMESINVENGQFIIYNLISEIEKRFNDNIYSCIAIESVEENQIDIIIGTNMNDGPFLYESINNLSSYAYSNFLLTITAAVGPWSKNPLSLNDLYQQVKVLMKYHYFYPKKAILSGDRLIARDVSKKKIDGMFLEGFDKSLKALELAKVKDALSALIKEIKTGEYSADYCFQLLFDTVYHYTTYTKEQLNNHPSDTMHEQLFEELTTISNIDMFEKRFVAVIDNTFAPLEEADKNKNNELIEKTKDYIVTHLSEELSLNSVAEVVHLSPRYLSRVFKKSTGENFVDYVTNERMKAAEKMLVTSEEKIEEIATKVGYNNPAYFTKKFKETYESAPSVYRNNHILQKGS